ncbi:PUA-like domain-containing protein [Pilobolus umbonatus]|nr:PUA-like domain-containing protein [Pilobolus umbonatus]
MDYLAPALTCKLCKHTMMDPITSPCGHTFCRICVLKEKIVSDQCTTCYRPLPKYNTLLTQPTHHIISRLVSNCRPIYPLDNPVQIPLFVSGTVILPGQKCRLPIFAPTHIRMFHQSLIMTENGLCLASVHRSRPQVAQFGTLLQIVNIEHRPDALLIDVLGLDRFKLSTHQQQEDSEEYHLLIADFELLKESNLPHASTLKGNELTASYSVELADTILQFIHHLSQSSTQPANSIHTYTHGLLGPLWYESRVTLHGPMPSKYDPAAVCWWAAVILPISASDLYLLLRTIPIIDRLEWVIQWMQQMESQWERCRSTAIHALSQIPQANH